MFNEFFVIKNEDGKYYSRIDKFENGFSRLLDYETISFYNEEEIKNHIKENIEFFNKDESFYYKIEKIIIIDKEYKEVVM
jgi:hypothetical protein